MSHVLKTDEQGWIKVANLGWLLRHNEDVVSFHVYHPQTKVIPPGIRLPEPDQKHYDCWLVANTTAGIYATTWASSDILLEWLDRPIFRDLPLEWFGLQTEVTKGQGK